MLGASHGLPVLFMSEFNREIYREVETREDDLGYKMI
jgi:hypothetical protein